MPRYTSPRLAGTPAADTPHAQARPRSSRLRSSSPAKRRSQSRGEVSCAECRRLRIKCDKQFPCKPCVKRGCQHLCPTGTNITAEGTKNVLAATGTMHDTVAGLRDRIRLLETALNDIHLRRTGHTHPLLAVTGEVNDDTQRSSPMRKEEIETEPDSTVFIRGTDGAHRVSGGAFGRTWATHSIGQPAAIPVGSVFTVIHPELARGIRNYPFIPVPPLHVDAVRIFREHLPSTEVLDALLCVFYASVGNSLLPAFTADYVRNTLFPTALETTGLPALAAFTSLFAILGIGALFAVEGPNEEPEVARYGRLSASAMGASAVLASPSIELVEGLYARSMLELLRQGQLEEPARFTLAMATHMCLALGLHRDAASFNLSAEKIERRRLVFWMVFKTDAWECLSIGRPTAFSFNTQCVDVRLPKFDSALPKVTWVLKAALVVLADISRVTLSLRPPSYLSVLELDEVVRSAGTVEVRENTPASLPPPTMILMYLHRAFYARALTQTVDPFLSEWSHSVNAAIRSARDTITWLQIIFTAAPATCAKMHYMWSIALNAAMIYKMLLDHVPHCAHAAEARAGLDVTIKLFKLGAEHGSGRAKRALTVFVSKGEVVLPAATPAQISRPTLTSSTTPKCDNSWNPKTIPSGFAFPLIDPDEAINISLSRDLNTQLSLSKSRDIPTSTPISPNTERDEAGPVPLAPVNPVAADLNVFAQPSSSTGAPELPYYDQPAAEARISAMWDGIGWASMNQGAMQLSVPEVDHSAGRNASGHQFLVQGLGRSSPNLASSLAGEWNMSWISEGGIGDDSDYSLS